MINNGGGNERLAPCRIPIQIIERHMKALGGLTKVEKTQRAVVAEYDSGKVRMEIFKTGIVHLAIDHGNAERKSFAVIESPEELSRDNLNESKDKISVNLPDGKIEYLPETMKLTYKSPGDSDILNLADFQFNDSQIVATFDIHGVKNFYGLGEKTLPFNKYGSRCTMWNSDFPAYSVKFDPLYESIPFLLKADTSGAYGLFFDNTFRSTFDVGASDSNKLVYASAGGAFELYIITGKNAAEVVQKFGELTGKMQMPPIWALGYQQSRYSYYPEQKVLDLAHGFRENKIPCDVIYLDINYMDGYRCFTWGPKDFPTPRNMLDTLHSLGFKVVTIIDPGIKDEKGYRVYDSGVSEDVFMKKTDGKYFDGQVWPGDCVFPDFLNEKTREWWGEQYKFLVDYGVDGFWNDMNEPSVFNSSNRTFPLNVIHELDGSTATHAEVHNVYGMQMARATREGLEKLQPDRRPFVLTRANYAGGQRYAAMWTGDNFASFAHMELALTMFLNLGVSGQPFVGSDVGGFMGNPDAELFSRWLELGVFTPFFRTHSVIDSKPREPWAFDPASTKINREIIDRRYELLPEIYTAFRNANQDGLPIIRPLYLNFPGDEEAYNISDEFLFGDNLLVAPVFDSGAVSRKVYLPIPRAGQEGAWMNFYDGSEAQNDWQEVSAPLGKTPLFVNSGTILFMQSLVQSTSEQADTLILKIYGNKSAKGKVYFDDGETLNYRHGQFLKLSADFRHQERHAVIQFGYDGDYEPSYKFMSVQIPHPGGFFPKRAIVHLENGKEVETNVRGAGENAIEFTIPFGLDIKYIDLD